MNKMHILSLSWIPSSSCFTLIKWDKYNFHLILSTCRYVKLLQQYKYKLFSFNFIHFLIEKHVLSVLNEWSEANWDVFSLFVFPKIFSENGEKRENLPSDQNNVKLIVRWTVNLNEKGKRTFDNGTFDNRCIYNIFKWFCVFYLWSLGKKSLFSEKHIGKFVLEKNVKKIWYLCFSFCFQKYFDVFDLIMSWFYFQDL